VIVLIYLHHRDQQRRQVLLALIVITFLGGLFFGTLNWMRDIVPAAVIEFAFSAFCVLAYPVVRKTRHLRRWALAITLPWILSVWLVVALPEAAASVFIWALVLPILLMFLLGRRIGLALSLISLLGALIIALGRFGLPENADQMAYAANLVIAAVAILVLSYVYERAREKAESNLHYLAVTDSLTGLPNRTQLYDNFSGLKAMALRLKTPLSLMLIDLDHFKQVNDRHGHDAGDRVLREVADLLRRRLRKSDQVYRMGGEEFLILMPDTSLEQATRLAEQLRTRFEAMAVSFQEQSIALTTSIGITAMTGPEENFDTLLRRADQNMYWCKDNGRNRVRAS
jgi:diguanylate cyclase (GGDEF)-like protein